MQYSRRREKCHLLPGVRRRMKTRRSIADQRRRSCRTKRRSFAPSPSAETVGGRVSVLQRHVATSYNPHPEKASVILAAEIVPPLLF